MTDLSPRPRVRVESPPRLIVTGASGLVGRHFLEAAQDRFRIYAIARRAQHAVGIRAHRNLQWIQVDIGRRAALERVCRQIEHQGGADLVLHLAAYYDFENREHPEFEHTNVQGTRNLLEQARRLQVRQFVFASSVAACRMPPPGGALTEASPPDAEFPYARSKRAGEEMMQEASRWFPCSITRLAAVFSDWCEYPPLYMFLSTWLSGRWDARILAGRGRSAVPYIHIRDLNRLLLLLLGRGEQLPPLGVYLASPNGATSHLELFERATRFSTNGATRPLLLPKTLARIGVPLRDLMGRLLGNRPFERSWMVDYIDTQLRVDASATCRELGWKPTPRLDVLRRLLFMIEKMKSEPAEWLRRNESAMKRPADRPNLVIHDALMEAREAIVDAITAFLQSPVRSDRFPNYAAMASDELRWYVSIVYNLLMASVRADDRTVLLHYIRELALRRFQGGFPPAELCDALLVIRDIVVEELLYKPRVQTHAGRLRDTLTLSIALAIDGVQDAYDSMQEAGPETPLPSAAANGRDLERIVDELNGFYRPLQNLEKDSDDG